MAHGGKDITITKHGMPVARLLPLEKAAATVKIKTRKVLRPEIPLVANPLNPL